MKRKAVTAIMLTILFMGMLTVAFNIQLVKSDWTWTVTVKITSDGYVSPATAPISRNGNVYTFTDNIVGDIPGATEAISVERDNIVLDGAGYTLQNLQAHNGTGINLHGRSNVTIKNVKIKAFYWGIYLTASSNNNTISGNNITGSIRGIGLAVQSSNNTVSGNNISTSYWDGIWLASSSNNTISANNITANNEDGIRFVDSSYNTVFGNNITNNGDGIHLQQSSYNTISGNNITNNVRGIRLYMYCDSNTISGNNITTNNDYGIWLEQDSDNNNISENVIADNLLYGLAVHSSNGNTVSENRVTNNAHGMVLESSSNNTVSGNNASSNGGGGIHLFPSSGNNTVYWNNATNNTYGFSIHSSGNIIWRNNASSNYCGVFLDNLTHNRIYENILTNDIYGLMLYSASNNTLFHNTFADNTFDTLVDSLSLVNLWDNGYPSGGNYWSDYTGTDLFGGPYQNVSGSDGIGDSPYTIDADNQDRYPLIKPYGGPHDIGITNITTTKTIVCQSYSLHINITIINYGVYSDNFNLTVYANTTVIDTLTDIPLASRNSTTLTFTWNTTGVAKGDYTIKVEAASVPYEIDLSDNSLTDGTVKVVMVGDLNSDNRVSITDIVIIALAFGAQPSDLNWNPNADLNDDGRITITDVVIAALHFGETDP